MKNRSIRSIGSIFLLIVLAVILAVGSAIWGDYQDKIMDNQKNQMLITSRMLAGNISFSMQGFRDELNYFRGRENALEDDIDYKKYLEIKDGPECNLFWENEWGTIIRMVEDMRLKKLFTITEINENENICMYEDELKQKYFVFRNKTDSQYWLCLVIDAKKYYEQLIAGLQIGTNGYIMVKNSDGMILMHPEENQWGIHVINGRKRLYPDMDYTSLEKMVEEQCNGGNGLSEYYSYWWGSENPKKVKKISAYASASLGQDFWVVSSVVDYEDFHSPIETGFRRVSMLFMGTLVFIVLLMLYLGKLLFERKKTMEEIVALREVNERLEEIHREEEVIAHQQRLQVMGTMTGGIAHEFNNFLTPIMGHAELLMMELPEESEGFDSAKEIYEASEKARDVIRQISSLSRRNVETVYKCIPVEKLFSRITKMMESICPFHVHLEKELCVKDEEILGNATQINQVLLNICVNAVHAIGKKEGKIRIKCDCVERTILENDLHLDATQITKDWKRYIQIEVSDDGCGMDEDTLRQIFIPFFTTKKTGEGTGLGLALAEQIINSHKGFIYAESEPMKGTTFRIFLPVMEREANQMVLEKNTLEQLRIVVADDNIKVLKLLEKHFLKLNVHITTCMEKKELKEILKNNIPDVLVIDESVADGRGVDFCMAIQGLYPDMIKIIMVDYFTKDVVEAKQKNIIDGYVSKPVSDTIILEAIRNCRE